jgi:two-component system nitrate/nitrite response regulator NarL
MRLLLADDHALFRDALVQYIERAVPQSVVILARDMHEVMEIMEGEPNVDLILLDLRMPGMNGLQGLEKLREKYSRIPVALLSGVAEKADVDQAIKLGAKAYFPKTLSGKAMLKGMQDVIDGKTYVATDHNSNTLMPSYYNGGHTAPVSAGGVSAGGMGSMPTNVKLTPRETEVLSYLLRGASNKEIAGALDLQVVTVKLHVRGICRKLGAKNRTQAALKAHEMGLARA